MADVAAEEPVADARPEWFGDGALEFNCQVGDALGGIEDAGLREGVGRAGVEAAGAGAAVGGFVDGVVVEDDIGEESREEEEAAGAFVDEEGVFAEPAETGEAGEVALEEWSGVDNASCATAGDSVVKEGGELFESLADEVVVVDGALGVGGNAGGGLRIEN